MVLLSKQMEKKGRERGVSEFKRSARLFSINREGRETKHENQIIFGRGSMKIEKSSRENKFRQRKSFKSCQKWSEVFGMVRKVVKGDQEWSKYGENDTVRRRKVCRF